jgi:hypothetical protein
MEFIQWCFEDSNSDAATIIVLLLIGAFILELIDRLKK